MFKSVGLQIALHAETSAAVDDVARLFGLKVNVLTRSWRSGFQENGSLWNQALAVNAYDDANSGGGAGARDGGRKRQRPRGAESASNRVRRADAGGGVPLAAGRGGGAAAIPAVAVPLVPRGHILSPDDLRVVQNAQPATFPSRSAIGGAARGGGAATGRRRGGNASGSNAQ